MALKKRIAVNTAEGHNKFWMLAPDPARSDQVYKCRNGRLGTNGQAQKDLYRYEGDSKFRIKVSEGYHEVNDKQFELLNTQAAIVGTQNKCGALHWVRQADKAGGQSFFTKVSEDELADPGYDPRLLVNITLKKETAGGTDFWMVFDPEGSSVLHGVSMTRDGLGAHGFQANFWTAKAERIDPKHPLRKLAEKVEQAMGRVFGG